MGLKEIKLFEIPIAPRVALVIVIVSLFIGFLLLTYRIVTPIWNNNADENMYCDYKEIIDEMIKEKETNKKKAKKKTKNS